MGDALAAVNPRTRKPQSKRPRHQGGAFGVKLRTAYFFLSVFLSIFAAGFAFGFFALCICRLCL